MTGSQVFPEMNTEASHWPLPGQSPPSLSGGMKVWSGRRQGMWNIRPVQMQTRSPGPFAKVARTPHSLVSTVRKPAKDKLGPERSKI